MTLPCLDIYVGGRGMETGFAGRPGPGYVIGH